MYLHTGHTTPPIPRRRERGRSLTPHCVLNSTRERSSARHHRPSGGDHLKEPSEGPPPPPRTTTTTTMLLTDLNRECLLHVFSFLDRAARLSLSLTCLKLRDVYLDPALWTLLRFGSPRELRGDDFVLGPALRCLSVRWLSSRVQQVCNVEDWMKSSFQRDICSKHDGMVRDFLDRVCKTCPNLRSLTLSGCGHITDDDVVSVLRSCRKLRRLHLENCVRLTDATLRALCNDDEAGGGLEHLEEVTVDYCRNVTQAGLSAVRQGCPAVRLSAVRSGDMLPDIRKPPEKKEERRRGQQNRTALLSKVLMFS